MELPILLFIGLIAGLIAGLMGVGGGIIFTPVLFFLFEGTGVEKSVQWSVASGLFCTLIATGSSTIRQYVQHNIFWKEGIKLGMLGAIGIILGKWVLTSSYYNREQFVVFFSLILFYVAFMMLQKGRDVSKESERAFSDLKLAHLAVTGGVGGFVASLAGVGGGGVMVPIMNLIYKQPFRKAVSVSQLGMTILVFVGVVQFATLNVTSTGLTNYALGYIDFGVAFPLSIGGLIGGFGGAYFNHKINRKFLQWGFAVLAVVMASRLLINVFL